MSKRQDDLFIDVPHDVDLAGKAAVQPIQSAICRRIYERPLWRKGAVRLNGGCGRELAEGKMAAWGDTNVRHEALWTQTCSDRQARVAQRRSFHDDDHRFAGACL
jgi:hypothetical protein